MIIPALEAGVNTKNNNLLENKACRRFVLGVLAMVGVPYEVTKQLFDISRSYYYSLRIPAERVLTALFGNGEETPKKILLVTKDFIDRCVMCLSLHCKVPNEGIVTFFDLVIGYHVSKGGIGRIQKAAVEKAETFDTEIHLETIKEIAIDEIFQQGKPVLTGIDLESNYVFLMKATDDRSGATWAQCLDVQKERGLNPELVVSDGGSGLLKGVEQTFPGIEKQPDVFHMLRGLGNEVHAIEKHGQAYLNEYCDVERRVSKRKWRKLPYNLRKKYRKMNEEIDAYLCKVDDVCILMDWLRECIGFTGYGYQQSVFLCEWILDEMSLRFPERRRYQNAIRSFREHLKELLSFLLRLRGKMVEKAKEYGNVNEHDFMLLYQQRFCTSLPLYDLMEKRLYQRFGPRLCEARVTLDEMIRSTRRASSMIENTNSCLRPFMNTKREVSGDFLILIKVYLNTKKAMRSRNKNRRGTSALDRLYGRQYPEFLDIVSTPMNYVYQI